MNDKTLVERCYLVRKGGYFYRPNAQGYTANPQEAGLYTFEEAVNYSHPNGIDGPRDGISYHHMSEFPAVETIEALQSRIEALEAALREVFIHGHSEGWRGNQMRRDVKHVDAEKSWSLYVSNGALEKTITRKALEGSGND